MRDQLAQILDIEANMQGRVRVRFYRVEQLSPLLLLQGPLQRTLEYLTAFLQLFVHFGGVVPLDVTYDAR